MRKFNVNVNGKVYYVEVEEASEIAVAPVVSQPVAASAVAPAPAVAQPVVTPSAFVAAPAAPKKDVPAGGTKVVAPMPGKILNLCVTDGATVKKGEKVVILEAMKMENEIMASADGVITFAVKKGDDIDTDAVIAYIK